MAGNAGLTHRQVTSDALDLHKQAPRAKEVTTATFIPQPIHRTAFLTCPPERAREILRAEGCWPRRPHWWNREEAEADYYVIAAFADLLEAPKVFDAAITAYLGLEAL